MALVADGRLTHEDLEAMRELRIAEQLGLDGPQWHEVLTHFCQDVLMMSGNSWACVRRLDPEVRARVMGEIREPRLQSRVLRFATQAAESDGPMDENESQMLGAFARHWNLQERRGVAAAA